MSSEAAARFDCFGGSCAVLVSSSGPACRAPDAVARARRRLLEWHDQFSRFDPTSELSRLNADPRPTVEISAVMARLIAAALAAARQTGGLVDPTLVGELRAAGYAERRESRSAPPRIALAGALAMAPDRRPARPAANARWSALRLDGRPRSLTRPPGTPLDSGGIAKGLFGDILAASLEGYEYFAIDAAGDVRLGGCGDAARPVEIAGPFDDAIIHTFHLRRGGVATSGIGRRIWLDRDGRPAHHLIDPASGRPAFTGLVQATALAPTAAEAEWRAKAALLSGPAAASRWLPHGGVLVADNGDVEVLEASDGLAGRPAAQPVLTA